eukprot:IDg20900t1
MLSDAYNAVTDAVYRCNEHVGLHYSSSVIFGMADSAQAMVNPHLMISAKARSQYSSSSNSGDSLMISDKLSSAVSIYPGMSNTYSSSCGSHTGFHRQIRLQNLTHAQWILRSSDFENRTTLDGQFKYKDLA